MKNARYIILFLMLFLVTIGVVSAANNEYHNTTDDSGSDISVAAHDTIKQDTISTANELNTNSKEDTQSINQAKNYRALGKSTDKTPKNAGEHSYTVTSYQQLCDAIDDSNTNQYQSTITLTGTDNDFTINDNNVITINTNITINGQEITINRNYDDGHGYSIFIVSSDNKLTLNNLGLSNNFGNAIYLKESANLTLNASSFTNDKTSGSGGAIYGEGSNNIVINNSMFTENSAATNGGAIFVTNNAKLDINNSTFTKNTANTFGGAIYTNMTEINVNSSKFDENYAKNAGGVIYTRESDTIINNSNFTKNSAGNGGAIYSCCYVQTATNLLNIDNCRFDENIVLSSSASSPEGGAVTVWDHMILNVNNTNFTNNHVSGSNTAVAGALKIMMNSTATIDHSWFDGNKHFYGGAIGVDRDSNLTLLNSVLSNNEAYTYGGAIFTWTYNQNRGYVNVNIFNTTFSNNKAAQMGGAILSFQRSQINITDSSFNDNSAIHGGSIFSYQSSNITINNTNFTNDVANSLGGSICNYGSDVSLIINNSQINASHALRGGAIYNNAKLIVDNSTISNNTVTEYGGAIANRANMNVTNTNFINNSAKNTTALTAATALNGGAIYNTANSNIINSTFEDNIAVDGGAVYNIANMNITLSDFNNNTAIATSYTTTADDIKRYGGFGGAIFNKANMTVDLCEFNNNSAKPVTTTDYWGDVEVYGGFGGAICNNATTQTINDKTSGLIFTKSNFTDNTAAYGGAFCNNVVDTRSINDCNFIGNNATVGGAIYQREKSNYTIDNCNFTGNAISYSEEIPLFRGGAISFDDASNLNITDSCFDNNTAFEQGGAICQDEYSNLTLENVNFTNNTCSNSNGGAIYQDNYCNMNVTNSIFTLNRVEETWNGGAIYQRGEGNLTVNNTLFSNNTGDDGGAIYVGPHVQAEINNTNFTYNQAYMGAGIRSKGNITVSNSNFISNNANYGPTIYNDIEQYYTNLEVYLSGLEPNTDYEIDINWDDYSVTTDDEGKASIVIPYEIDYEFDEGYFELSVLDDDWDAVNTDILVKLNGTIILEENGEYDQEEVDYSDVINPYASYNLLTVNNTTFTNNTATTSGVLYNFANAAVDNSNFTSNIADNNGGAILTIGSLNLTNSQLTNNTARNSATVYVYSGDVNITSNNFTDNWVSTDDGWVVYLDENTVICDNLFVNNTDNTRDMLFNVLGKEVHGNIYIDNYLEDSFVDSTGTPIEEGEVIYIDGEEYQSKAYEYPVYLSLRNVYNDSIRNGTVYLYYDADNLVTSGDVVDNQTTLEINAATLQYDDNNLVLNYTSLSKHYQNIFSTLEIILNNVPTNITVNVNQSILNKADSVRIYGTLKDAFNNTIPNTDIVLKIDDEIIEDIKTNANGEYEYVVDNLEVGEYTVTAYYPGSDDDRYQESNIATTTYIVKPYLITININKDELYVDEDLTIFGLVTNATGQLVQDGEVILQINNTTSIQLPITNGQYFTTINCTVNGSYLANATYTRNDDELSTSLNETYLVSKIPTTTSYEVINSTYQNVVIEVFVKENVPGKYENIISKRNLTVTADDVKIGDYIIDDLNAIINVEDIEKTGDITLKVDYNGDYKYLPSKYEDTVNIQSQESYITVDVDTNPATLGQSVNIYGQVFNEYDEVIKEGIVEITINSTLQEQVEIKYDEQKGDYYYTIENETITAGNISVHVKYLGKQLDDTYLINPSENDTSFIVDKIKTITTIDEITDVEVGKEFEITVTLTDEDGTALSNKPVIIKVNDEIIGSVPETDDDGKTTVKYVPQDNTPLTIEALFEGDDTYNKSEDTLVLEDISLSTPVITVDVNNTPMIVGESVLIRGTLVDGQNHPIKDATIIMYINDELIDNVKTDESGVFTHEVTNLEKGDYTVTVKYDGLEGKYTESNTATTQYEVLAYTIKINMQRKQLYVDESETIYGMVFDGRGNPVTTGTVQLVFSNGSIVPLELTDGEYGQSFKFDKNGTYTVYATYLIDEREIETSKTIEYTVDKIPTTTIANIIDTTIGQVTLEVYVQENVPGIYENIISKRNITVNITGQEETERFELTSPESEIVLTTITTTGPKTLLINYEGDYKYINSSTTLNIDVTAIQSYITVDVHNTPDIFNKTVTITGSVYTQDDEIIQTGFVEITIEDTLIDTVPITYDSEHDNYIYSLDYITTKPGEYNVEVKYLGQLDEEEQYYIIETSQNKTKFTANKRETTITIEPISDVQVNNEFNITITLKDQEDIYLENKEVTITINDEIIENVPLTDANGQITIGYIPEDNTPITIEVKFDEDDYYLKSNNTLTIEDISLLDTTITVKVNESILAMGDDINITGLLVDENNNPIANKEISMYINDEQITDITTDENGQYSYSISDLQVGNYEVTVQYAGLENIYKASNIATTTYEVQPHKITININNDKVYVDEEITIHGTVTNAKNILVNTGSINLNINNDTIIPVELTNGEYTITIKCDKNDTYTANATYILDDKEIVTSKNVEYTVEKIPTKTTFNIINNDYDNIEIEVFVQENVPGKYENILSKCNITVTIDENTDEYEINATDSYITLTTTKTGNIEITVLYEGDYKYLPSNKTENIQVNPKESYITVELNTTEVKIGESVKIYGQVFDENDEIITDAIVKITINDILQSEIPVTYNPELEGYYYTLTNITSTIGNMAVDVEYLGKTGDDDVQLINPSQNSTSFIVNKINTNLSLNNIPDVKNGETVTIHGILIDENGKVLNNTPVTVNINGNDLPEINTDNYGYYTLDYPTTTSGLNNVSVSYAGGDKYNATSNNTTFNVDKIATTITAVQLEDTPGDISVSITLKDEDGNNLDDTTVIVTFPNGTTIPVTINDGNAILPLETIPGEIKLDISYEGNNTYKESQTSITIKTEKLNTTITLDNINDVSIRDKVEIRGMLFDQNDKILPNTPIIIKVNGEEIPTTTNNYGLYTVEYITTTSGTNNVTVSYDGDDYYNGAVNATTFNVDKISTTITAVQSGDTPENTGIVISLVDEDENPLDNAIITVTLPNGTQIPAVVKDGSVSVPIDTVPGELEVEISYDGNDTYKESETSITIKTEKLNTTIIVNDIGDVKVGDKVTIGGLLRDQNGKVLGNAPIIIKVNGEEIPATTDENGLYSIEYTTTTSGENNVVVSYDGDDYYNGAVNATVFNVDKKSVVLDVTQVGDTPQDTKLVINVTDENGNPVNEGKVTVTLPDGTSAEALVEDGKVTIPIDTLPGQTPVSISYNGTDTYESEDTSFTVNTERLNTTITINDIDDVKVGDKVTIGGLLRDQNGKILDNAPIIIKVNDEEIPTLTDENGLYSIEYTTTTSGENNVVVSYDGDDYYNGADNATVFNVDKKSVVLDVSQVGDTPQDTKLVINVTDEDGNPVNEGKVTVTLPDGSTTEALVNNGKVTIPIDTLPGQTPVSISYNGTDTYESEDTSFTVNTERLNTTITINDIDDVKVGDKVTIGGLLRDQNGKVLGNAPITIKVNDEEIPAATDENGLYSIEYTTTTSGENNVIVSYDGDDYYNGADNATTFNVDKISTTITAVQSGDTPENTGIVISLVDEDENPLDNAIITVTLPNGMQIPAVVKDGSVSVPIDTVPGELEVEISYDGNDTYKESETSITIKTEKLNTTIIVNDIDDVKVGDKVTIGGLLRDQNGKVLGNAPITIKVNDEEIPTATDENGLYSIDYTAKTVGENNVVVSYDGDDYYNGAVNATVFNVDKKSVVLDVTQVGDTPQDTKLVINVTDEDGNPVNEGKVTVTLPDGSTTEALVNNGQVTIPIDTLPGQTPVNITYNGTDTYKAENTTFNVKTQKLNTTSTINNISDKKVGDTVTINGVLLDQNDKILPNTPITVKVNNENIPTTTDEYGLYTIDVTAKTAGINNVTVAYDGDDYYNGAVNATVFNVDKKSVVLDVSQVGDTPQDTKLVINVTDEDGNPVNEGKVTVTLPDGSTTEALVNNGKVTIPIDTLPGQTPVTISYNGTDTYESEDTSFTVNTERLNTTITINDIDDVKVGDKVTIGGLLRDQNGKILDNAPIIIKVNGEEIPTITDENGLYSIDYTAKTAGINNVTVSYDGDDYYNGAVNATTFNVDKKSVNLSASQIGDKEGNISLVVDVVDEDGNPVDEGVVIATLPDGSTVEANVKDGKATIPLDTKPGQSNIQIKYNGTDTYNPVQTSIKVNTSKLDCIIPLNNINDVIIKDNVTITGILLDENDKILPNMQIIINVNGRNVDVTNTNSQGIYSIEYTADKVGLNNVTVSYLGNDEYNNVSNSTTFIVDKNNVTINTKFTNDSIDNVTLQVNITGNNPTTTPSGNIIVTSPNGTELANVPVTSPNNNISLDLPTGNNQITISYSGNDEYNPVEVTDSVTIDKKDVIITINPIQNITFTQTTNISGLLTDKEENAIKNAEIVLDVDGVEVILKTNNQGQYSTIFNTTNIGLNNVTATFNGNNIYNNATTNNTFNASKINVFITIPDVNGTIGENITLSAKIVDEFGNPVNGGQFIFKINGLTLKADGKLNSTQAPMILSPVNGTVEVTILADTTLRSAKNITGAYGETSKYYSSRTITPSQVNIAKREAQITVTAPNTTKQDINITFTAKVTDITHGTNNGAVYPYDDNFVIFKVNGVTIKDADGNAIKTKVVDGIAQINYYIPPGLAGTYANQTNKPYTVEAVFGSSEYYADVRNTTQFIVEKSPIHFNYTNVTYNSKYNALTIQADILDYHSNLLKGTNSLCVKVNGQTYKIGDKTSYYNVNNGKVNLSIQLKDNIKDVTSVELVTAERVGYLGGRQTTTEIIKT